MVLRALTLAAGAELWGEGGLALCSACTGAQFRGIYFFQALLIALPFLHLTVTVQRILESWTSLKTRSLHPFPRKEMHIVTFKTKILLTVCRGEERGGDGGRRNPRELK